MRLLPVCVSLVACVCLAGTPGACVGSQSLATFKLSVEPAKAGPALPIREVNALRKGEKLTYAPVHIPPPARNKAEVALLLAPPPNSSASLEALKPAPAARPATWTLPRDTSVVAVVYGPQGLSMRKVKSLIENNDEVLSQLADYADETSKVASLIEALQESESSGSSVDGALAGFSARSGVSVAPVDPHTATSQQALALLHALQPAMSSMDPLTASNTAVAAALPKTSCAHVTCAFGETVTTHEITCRSRRRCGHRSTGRRYR